MGNKTSERSKKVPKTHLSIPEMTPKHLRVSPIPKLLKLKEKCQSLNSKKKISTSTKISIIKQAIPGLYICYDPLKTYYSIDKVVMAGKFGAISKAYCKQDLDTQVIVKVFNLENITSHLFLVIQDLVIFSKTNHSNICKLKNVLCHNNKLYLVLDYVECMTLSDYVLDQGKLIEEDALTIISQLLNVLHYFNSKNIAHRDFKPDNILINPDNLQIKL